MANKVVLGAASLGIAGYYLNENLKDRRVQQEEEERRQHLQDLEEEREQRRREAASQRGRRGLRQEEKNTQHCSDVAEVVHTKVQEKLLAAIESIRDQARVVASMNRLGSSLMALPLLSRCNEPSEVVLGAALALASSVLIHETLMNSVDHSPGLALAKLSKDSLRLIREAFALNSLQCYLSSHFREYHEFEDLTRMALLHSSVGNGGPVAVRCTIKTDDTAGLFALAGELNLCLIREDAFKEQKTSTRRITYVLDHKAARFNWFRKGDTVFLANFFGSFSVPIILREGRMYCSFEPGGIKLFKGTRVQDANRGKAIEVLASFFAGRATAIAAQRLEELESDFADSGGLSLEHITVRCGYSGPFLQELAGADVQMIEANSSRLACTLAEKLQRCVPSPDIPAKVESTDTTATKALKDEVSNFVSQYIKLLNLSYCEIPRLKGRAPSACVTSRLRVFHEALKDILVFPNPLVARTRRLLEQEERERLLRSRKLSAPSMYTTAGFLCAWCCLWYWLSFAGLRWSLPRGVTRHGILLHVVSFGFGQWAAFGFLSLLESPLRVAGKESAIKRIWAVSATIVEILFRTTAVMLGTPVPFDAKIQALKQSCQQQHQAWMVRISRREYYRALRRKRITEVDCKLLLESFVEWNAKKGRAEGVLPGDIEDAEAFLRVEVEEPRESEDEASSQLQAFMELTNCVEGSLTFSVGDRVVVKTKLVVERTPFSGTAPMESNEIIPAKAGGRKGSVVAAFPCNNVVLFDGTFLPEFVSASSCQLLNAHDELDDGSDSQVDRLKTKAILNEEVSTTEIETDESNNDDDKIYVDDDDEDEDEEEEEDASDDDDKEEEPIADGTRRKGKGKVRTVKEDNEEEPFGGETRRKRKRKARTVEDDKEEEEEEEDNEPIVDDARHESKRKARTVQEALEEGGWKLIRTKKHIRYRRVIESAAGNDREQHFTMAKTPSDHRASKNALSILNRLNASNAPSLPWDEYASDEDVHFCSVCVSKKPESSFSKNQIKKGTLKCKDCVAEALGSANK